jgi:hypothetical protein
MGLRHHVHRHGGRTLGGPLQHRIRATRDVVGHHQVADREILPQSQDGVDATRAMAAKARTVLQRAA